jgi:ABC-type uncharacterized transport system involved in gliding motility auxiliary subunit
MQTNVRIRLQMLAQNGLFVVLLVALTALLAYFAQDYRLVRDVTQNGRNTLSQQAREVLGKLGEPVKITIFAAPQDVRGDLRKQLRDFFVPYQRVKADITVNFVDPREEPKLAQAAGIRVPGEGIIEYGSKKEHLTTYNEQTFVNALMRLMRAGERLLMSVDGHGERRLNGTANHDLGEFGKQLNAKGFQTNSLNLAIAPEVPANANVLLIATPQVDLQAAEVQKIRQFVQSGGNLLWLIDQEPLRGLQPIAEQLGLVLGPGTVVDPDAARLNASPAIAIGAGYGRHAITDNFTLNTVFPFARQIGANEGRDWRVTRLIDVAPRGWVEMGKLDAKISFDKGSDLPGPVTIALALERNVKDRAQRVVVIGNGSFLANQFLGNGGNLDLGMNMVNWLAGDDAMITLQPRATVDGNLELGRGAQYFLLFGFLIFLPLSFAAVGTMIWWRRRKG